MDEKVKLMTEKEMTEYEEVKKNYDEFFRFRKMMNKPKTIILDIEGIEENLKQLTLNKKQDNEPGRGYLY